MSPRLASSFVQSRVTLISRSSCPYSPNSWGDRQALLCLAQIFVKNCPAGVTLTSKVISVLLLNTFTNSWYCQRCCLCTSIVLPFTHEYKLGGLYFCVCFRVTFPLFIRTCLNQACQRGVFIMSGAGSCYIFTHCVSYSFKDITGLKSPCRISFVIEKLNQSWVW